MTGKGSERVLAEQPKRWGYVGPGNDAFIVCEREKEKKEEKKKSRTQCCNFNGGDCPELLASLRKAAGEGRRDSGEGEANRMQNKTGNRKREKDKNRNIILPGRDVTR